MADRQSDNQYRFCLEGIELARNLLVLACSDDIQGDIVITGHPEQGLVTLLGYKTWRRDAESRDLAAEQLIRPTASDEAQ
jgi:hypothetical protein